ncbi:MAG: hypothetical protein QF464_12085, partial [Myxococcota bacterium]|nr:hypothetical protein [Myxococcota bacterium]
MLPLPRLPSLFLLAVVMSACAGEAESVVATEDAVDGASSPELPGTPDPDAVGHDVPLETVDAAIDAEAAAPVRTWAHRAIGGISMGAAATIIGLRQPEMFDTIAGLGGYMDLRYMVTTGQRLQLAGFCPLAHLEAHVETLDDPDADPPIFCGPVSSGEALEFSQDYNHFHYDTNGAHFDRGFYISVLQGLTMAYGNFTSRPSDISPYLPTGIDLDTFQSTPKSERCVDPTPIPAALAFNAEYNPTGAYPVIPYCDSDGQTDPDAPDSADFDPAYPHTKPVDIALAVDIDGDGERDFGEPIFLNTSERYEDVGVDGCPDAREDGAGGCLAAEAPAATEPDPNGDNYDWWSGALETEGNYWHDPGEPFADHGLDGVPETGDVGEADGDFDRIPSYDRADLFTASRMIADLPDASLERLDFYFDAGIRD